MDPILLIQNIDLNKVKNDLSIFFIKKFNFEHDEIDFLLCRINKIFLCELFVTIGVAVK